MRVGMHTGTPVRTAEGYVGHDVHRAARVAAAGHGGQVLVAASTAPLVDVELIDLGEHRFKDLSAPERVFQLGEDDFPPLKSLYRTSLPIPATPFLGRLRELEDVIALLRRAEARLVTLVGPGGAGKTRLALQAAAEVSEDFRDGVFWVPLAPLRDETAVPTALAQALDVDERPGESLLDSIVSTVADMRLLLVVDNCEHLVGAVAALVRALLDASPSLVVVASSRERLGLRAERLYDVPPMITSDAEALPLAIELAAARVRSLSAETIRSRLDERLVLLTARTRDFEERQRTLEATIAWSYDLLGEFGPGGEPIAACAPERFPRPGPSRTLLRRAAADKMILKN